MINRRVQILGRCLLGRTGPPAASRQREFCRYLMGPFMSRSWAYGARSTHRIATSTSIAARPSLTTQMRVSLAAKSIE